MSTLLHNLWRDDQAQDVAEYALMLAVILLVVVGAVGAIGTTANGIFNNTNTSLSGT